MLTAVRILIVDDHHLVAETLARVLLTYPGIEIAGIAHGGPEAIALTQALSPSVVLMDLGLRGMDGVEATWTLRRQFPRIPVLVLTMFDQEAYVVEALRAGARGYLLKTASTDELVDALRAVAAGQRVLDRRLPPAVGRQRSRRLGSRGPFPLSLREMEVMQRVSSGRTVREIAEDLCLSPHTIRNHLKAVYRKLGVHSQAEAAVHALRRGLA